MRIHSLIFFLYFAYFLQGCAGTPPPSASKISCQMPTYLLRDFMLKPNSMSIVKICEKLAQEGDKDASKKLTKYYSNRWNSDPFKDLKYFKWLRRAAELGDEDSIKKVIFSHGFGFRENHDEVMRFIQIGVSYGYKFPSLGWAAYQEDKNPEESYRIYMKYALQDDCPSQWRLALSYYDGIFTEVNEAKAYFWSKLASRWRRSNSSKPYVHSFLSQKSNSILSKKSDSGKKREYIFSGYLRWSDCNVSVRKEEIRGIESFEKDVDALFLTWEPGKGEPKELDQIKIAK